MFYVACITSIRLVVVVLVMKPSALVLFLNCTILQHVRRSMKATGIFNKPIITRLPR